LPGAGFIRNKIGLSHPIRSCGADLQVCPTVADDVPYQGRAETLPYQGRGKGSALIFTGADPMKMETEGNQTTTFSGEAKKTSSN